VPFTPRRLEGTPYRLDSVLGEGAMGEVYLGEHVDLRRPAVIKLIKAKYASEEQVAGRMRREARIVASLRHDALVTIYDLGVAADGRTYIAMEYLEGTVLRQILQTRGVIPVEEAARWMAQACDGIEVAHQAGVIHRDIKPENLFLTATGQMKVLDFGVAKPMHDGDVTSARTAAGMVLGTPRYMSPEQATGRALFPATDVYAVGCVLFEMLTGGPLYEGLDARELLRHHLMTQPPSLAARTGRTFDPELEALVARTLAKEPAQRFARAADLAAALRRLADRRPSVAPPREPSVHDKPTVRVDPRALVEQDVHARPTVRVDEARQHDHTTVRVDPARASFLPAGPDAGPISAYDDTRAIPAMNLVAGVSTTEQSPMTGMTPASARPPAHTARTEVLNEVTPPGGTGSLAAEVSTFPIERRGTPLWPFALAIVFLAGIGTTLVFVMRAGRDEHVASNAPASAAPPPVAVPIAIPAPEATPTPTAAPAPPPSTTSTAKIAAPVAKPEPAKAAITTSAKAPEPEPSATATVATSAYDKARTLMNDGDLDAAEREARASIATHGNAGRLLLGEILEKKGKPALARDVYKQILTSDPNNAVAKTRLAKLGG